MDDRWGTIPDSPIDRLAALRPGSAGTTSRPRRESPGSRIFSREMILALVLLLLGAFVVLLFVGRGQQTPVVASISSVTEPTVSETQLPRGRALAAALLDQGSYPPELTSGDSVVVILTPHSSAEGTTRMLPDTATVMAVREVTNGTLGAVVTLVTSETAARDMADAGTIHLAIVPRAD